MFALLALAHSRLCGPAVPAAWYHGEAAKKELAAATRVKGQDEAPPASAYDAVDEPPEIREEEYGVCRDAPCSCCWPILLTRASALAAASTKPGVRP